MMKGFVAAAFIFIGLITTATAMQANAKSLVGDYSTGYDAGKAAAKAGQSDACDGTGTLYCAGFHIGWAVARHSMETLR
jgi:hypothetical protein